MLTELPALRILSLGKVPARESTLLSAIRPLEELCLFGSNISFGAQHQSIRQLRCLRLVNLRKLATLEAAPGLITLERLYLERLPSISKLPSFEPLVNLHDLWVETLRNVHDISPLARARSLERFTCLGMPQLEAAHFQSFRGHPSLRQVYYSSGPFSAAIWGRAGHQTQNQIRELLALNPESHSVWPNWNE